MACLSWPGVREGCALLAWLAVAPHCASSAPPMSPQAETPDASIDRRRDTRVSVEDKSDVGVTPPSGTMDAAVTVRDAAVATPDAPADTATRETGAPDLSPPSTGTIVAWNGESVNTGRGWATPNSNTVAVIATDAQSAPRAVGWTVVPGERAWAEWGWNWAGFSSGKGVDVGPNQTFRFFIKITGTTVPSDFVISVRSAMTGKYANQPERGNGLRGVSLKKYAPTFASGDWVEVRIPMSDLLAYEADLAPFVRLSEVFVGGAATGGQYTLLLDDLSFTSAP